LERKVADLSRRLAAVSGPGVSTLAGSQNIRTTQLGFAAQLTAAWDNAVGYAWKRRRLDTTASPIALSNPGVQPTGNKAYPIDGDKTLAVGTPVWMEPSPDGAGYLFVDAGGSGGGGGVSSSCNSDTWLKHVAQAGCWTIYRQGGSGRCSGWAVDDPTAVDADGFPTAGITAMLWGSYQWLGLVGNTADGSPASGMIQTPCGCGSVNLTIVPGAASGARATLTLGGVHVSCAGGGSGSSGGGGGVYTEVLTDYCIVSVGGKPAVLFTGYSADSCDGEDEPCDNTFKILAVCNTECPPFPACGCAGLDGSPAPIALASFGFAGFADDALNGDWVWNRTGDPATSCTWEALICGPSSITYDPSFEFAGGGDPAPAWVLTHGGSVYAVAAPAPWPWTMAKQSGDGPDTLTVGTVAPGAGDTACCQLCEPDDLRAKTGLTATMTSSCGCMSYSMALTLTDVERMIWASALFDDPCPESTTPPQGRLRLQCTPTLGEPGYGIVGLVFSKGVDGSGGEGATQNCAIQGCAGTVISCDPLHVQFVTKLSSAAPYCPGCGVEGGEPPEELPDVTIDITE
jgi:hypothetical protein